MVQVYSAGHDFGNSLTKSIVYVNGRPKNLTIASAVNEGDFSDLLRKRQGIGRDASTVKDALFDGEYIVEYGGKQYFVGDLAIAQSSVDPTSIGDASRYWNIPSLIALLTTTGNTIKDHSYELLVVTGLPVDAHREDNVKKVKSLLNGVHVYSLNGRERTVRIKVAKVLMEAAGAVLYSGLDDGSKTYGVIDVGSFTTDFYALEGINPISKQCGTEEVGVSHVVGNVMTRFEQKYQFPLTRRQKEIILPCYQSGNYGDMGLANARMYVDLAKWTGEEVDTVSSAITGRAKKLWRTGNQGMVAANFSRVEIVGGGAYYFTDAITQVVTTAKCAKTPELSNVRGYAWFAEKMLQARTNV